MTWLLDLQARAKVTFFDYQVQALVAAKGQSGPSQRRCLYYKTGAGKSYTGLAQLALWGQERTVVIAPPSTHQSWANAGQRFGIEVETMSHAKFRMPGTKLSRHTPVIADEFHLFGGHKGKGWKRLSQLGRSLQAPLVLASATPNYNDAERVYCIQAILDPHSVKGGYLEFLYRECNTVQNPYGMEPLLDEDRPFRRFKDAAEYLAALPNVDYLPDDLVYTITDIEYDTPLPWAYEVFGYNEREHRLVASQMEDRHTRAYQQLVGKDRHLHDHVWDELGTLIQGVGPVLVYANHATVAEAAAQHLVAKGINHALVTGGTTKRAKDENIDAFKRGEFKVLIGTASLATGTDGLDKVCDRLIILDDTDDDALRRQLIGRIMPRGSDTDASKKQVYRLVHRL